MKIVMIAGSNRKGAASTFLLRYIGSLLQGHQISVTCIELKELELPLYSPDTEGLSSNVQYVLEMVKSADGLIFATPEYHGSISGVLKNALDYMNASHVSGKPVLSVSSAGGPVGVSSLTHLQSIIRNLHGVDSPEWISIGAGSHGFDSEGVPLDAGLRDRVDAAVEKFLALTRMLTVDVMLIR